MINGDLIVVQKAAIIARRNQDKLIEIIGWYGAVAFLMSYILVSANMLTSVSFAFQILNISGASAFIIISKSRKLYQGMFLNTIWIVIGVTTIIIYAN